MQVVSSTPIAAALLLLLLLLGPYRGLPVFWLTLPFGTMAVVGMPALGGASIIVADFAVLTLGLLLVLRPGGAGHLLGQMRAWRPGAFLALLIAYAVIATFFFPRVFVGETEVFSMGRVAGSPAIIIRPLAPGSGNLTQLFRLMLGFMLFFVGAALMMRRPEAGRVVTAVKVATLAHLVLGLMDLGTFATGTVSLMEPFRTANYAMTESHQMAGFKRMIGGFSEASAFGYFALGLFGFWFRYWLDSGRSKSDSFFLAIALFVVLRSTSTSAYIGAAAFVLAVLMIQVWQMRTGGMTLRSAGFLVLLFGFLPVVLLSGLVTYELNEEFRTFLDDALLNKLGSSSGLERMSWNTQALLNLVETNYLGAGLGSIRASNWLIACLGTMGLLGTALYLAFIVSLFGVRAPGAPRDVALVISATKSGALALLLGALFVKSSPDLEHLFHAFGGVAAGLAQGATRAAAAGPYALRPASLAPGRLQGSA